MNTSQRCIWPPMSSPADVRVGGEQSGAGALIDPAVRLSTARGARNLPIPPTPDLFVTETREQKRARHYAAAKRWADRIKWCKGEDRRRCYEIMRKHLMAGLKA